MKKLGEILLEEKLISREQFQHILEIKKTHKKRLGELVVELGFSSERDIAIALSKQLGFPFIDLGSEEIDPEAVNVLDESLARQNMIFPFKVTSTTLHFAIADPLSFSGIDDVRFKSGLKVEPAVATASDIKNAIEKYYDMEGSLDNILVGLGDPTYIEVMSTGETTKDVAELKKKGTAPPIVKTVNSIITNAIERRASDVHLEPHKTRFTVRERVDGVLSTVVELPRWTQASIVSRLKIMADLDISEKRNPQDGRIRVRTTGTEVDLRISTLPTRFGEKAEIRLLNSQYSIKPMAEIGLTAGDYGRIKGIIEQSQGLVLVTGPTGSGKSTTLYTFLHHIQSDQINIVTLEDPIEYELESISQVQVNEKGGFSFAGGLRSVLRQDPDVIMVGEMRDNETAEIAMRASITGHLVFSTLHTNDAVSTVTRLIDMGIPSYLASSSLSAVVSQRLVRMVCSECREPRKPTVEEAQFLGIRQEEGKVRPLYQGKGCRKCHDSGYYGRIAIFEILVIDKHMRELISLESNEEMMYGAARKAGMSPLWDDAVKKVLQGLTTLEEIKRIVHRKDPTASLCRACGKKVDADFLRCPHCGVKMANECPSCKKHLDENWHFCPYCSISLDDYNKGAPDRGMALKD
ncbi:MAG: ATPase, T2SS/T4P/T4SS family [Deltaproteobacteria bacterium]|nr:ATPase, T2SS/T4P/T4SS family [Deltaproteobacteria bacterium]